MEIKRENFRKEHIEMWNWIISKGFAKDSCMLDIKREYMESKKIKLITGFYCFLCEEAYKRQPTKDHHKYSFCSYCPSDLNIRGTCLNGLYRNLLECLKEGRIEMAICEAEKIRDIWKV